ncbi:MAG: NADH-quinone oxidoreductase subunit J family protein, partial [Nitriliruptorales bacterium]
MSAEVVLFWFFSIIAIGSGIAMILMRNVVHGALMLVLSFFGVAGLFLVLQSAFLAAIQVIVYAGAIMVLFLFVLMLLGVGRDDLLVARSGAARAVGFGLALLLVVAVGFVFVGPFTGADSVCGTVREATQEPTAGVVRCA